MTSALCRAAALLVLLLPSACAQKDVKASGAGIPQVSFCELFENNGHFLGQLVMIKVRITAYKHGTGIWDPACKSRGADLKWSEEARSKPGTLQLDDSLRKFGMGDHPVIATLTGKWMGKQDTGVGFLPQPRYVFLMLEATNVDRTKDVERP
jgi:hypothetical protein